MNNDSTPSYAPAQASPEAPQPPTTSQGQNNAPAGGAIGASASDKSIILTPAQQRAQAQTKKKHEFVNYLMNNLDLIIYSELCILYYMESVSATILKYVMILTIFSCSFFRLLIRVLSQMVFLSPKPNFVPPMPQHRPYIGSIFGPNIICILLHVFTARSEAGEAMRGYLHGGIIIDLIGQKGPTSKLHLVLLDILILLLQCLMLTVHVERERLSGLLTAFTKVTPLTDQPRAEVISTQNIDAEERGIMGETDAATEMPGGTRASRIEPQESFVRRLVVDEVEEEDMERAQLLGEPLPREDPEDNHPLDMFFAGTAIIADLHIIDTLKKQWADYGNASASALQTVGFSAEFAATTANRRINAASERIQRSVESLSGSG